jgi:pimeloyl-ACP methyl ester carboxylesterase
LLNPQLNYKWRTIDSRPYWSNDYLSDEVAQQLTEHGYIQFTPSLRNGRAILNEVFWLEPHTVLNEIMTPSPIVHGTRDTFVPIESSMAAVSPLTAEHKLVEIDGAQHGFAVHEDPQYLNPQSQAWQAFVIQTVAGWFTGGL